MNGMKIKYLFLILFPSFFFPVKSVAQRVIVIHTNTGQTIRHSISEIDSITVDSDFYIPTFRKTNITSGAWDGFAEYGNRFFATNAIEGISEYKDGIWKPAVGVPQDGLYYPIVKAVADRLIIACPRGILMQSGNDVYHWAIWYTTTDYAGTLGGSKTNFFAGAGTNGRGIFRWNGGEYFSATNQIAGCWYSIEALDENTIFFGAGATHVSGDANYGIKRWDNTRQEVVNTNIESGVFKLTLYNNKMYAADGGSVYVWNAGSFAKIRSGEKLRVAGNNMYCFASEGILKYNSAKNTFELFVSKDIGSFNEIEEYQNYIYLFGKNTIALNKNTQERINVECDFKDISIAAVTQFGLFVSNSILNIGIQKMVPSYQ